MAKKATSKPAEQAAKTAAAAPVLPASDEPAQSPEQGMTAPTSTVAGLSPSAVDSPVEGVGDASPQVSLSPAIEEARSYITPHGVPDSIPGNYYTPPPPDLRSGKAKR